MGLWRKLDNWIFALTSVYSYEIRDKPEILALFQFFNWKIELCLHAQNDVTFPNEFEPVAQNILKFLVLLFSHLFFSLLNHFLILFGSVV